MVKIELIGTEDGSVTGRWVEARCQRVVIAKRESE